ncbi:hypothetical protein D3C75_1291230 [compost metagenome]
MGRYADDFMRSKPLTDRTGRFILLADMNPVGIKGNSQVYIIVHDEGNPVFTANALELPGQAEGRVPA